jgi:DNA replication protein DnaC
MSANLAEIARASYERRRAAMSPEQLEHERAELDALALEEKRAREDAHRAWVDRQVEQQIPARFHDVEPDETDAGTGLYLFGTVGTGKTHRACALMRAAIDRGRKVRFVHVGSWLDRRRESYGGGQDAESVAYLVRCELLVLDDIGLERPNEYALDSLGVLVNEAYNACTPLVVTSNLTFAQLADRIGARIVDRLTEVCTPVRMNGASKRARKSQ